jgi:3-phenylpropionate/trans-cinnamate dioxygenase ferredoxin reductase subunit
MATLKADLGTCQGYANCVAGAEDYFDIDDDGVVVLLKIQVADSDRSRVEEAVRSCPVSALLMED